MKPNFALSLSFEGICLLQRAADGWRVVGDVGLDSPDLTGELAVLRTKASDLDMGGVRTKLIIPNDQIKYIPLETGDISSAERTALAIQALEGATPYAVDDLAYAISTDGEKTYIAAVARETLAEAEAFAKEHRFHPVSWVATPEDGAFEGEPFFGQTLGAAELIGDETVQEDNAKIVILGNVVTQKPPVVTVDLPEEITVAAEPIIPPKKDKPKEASAQTIQDDVVAAPLPAEIDEHTLEIPAEPNVKIEAPEDPLPQNGTADSLVAVGFTSRRTSANKGPSLGGATRDLNAASVTKSTLPLNIDTPETTPLVVPTAPKPSIAASFLSSRKAPKPDVIPAPATVATKPSSEAQRLTIFGARKTDKKGTVAVGGKPRYLGLLLTAVLLLFLAGVAAWASVFMDEGLARFFGGQDDKAIAQAPAGLIPPAEDENAPVVTTASLSPDLSSEDAAVLDALRAPRADPAVVLPELTPEELIANYAVTGIWPQAPEVPQPAPLVPLEDLYITSIDPISSSKDAVALPNVRSLETDRDLGALNAPLAAGTAFALGTDGLVVPTVSGALTPDGVRVFLGRPAVVPPKTPVRLAKVEDTDPVLALISKLRPRPRPSNLVEQNERSSNGGLTRNELAELRPRIRPPSATAALEPVPQPEAVLEVPETAPDTRDAQTAAAAAAAAASLAAIPKPAEIVIEGPANPQAVLASKRPDGRPRNFARTVRRAIANKPKEDQGTRVASIAPRTVTPKIPTSASVTKSATVENAINLRAVNLIGVYGKPSSRRALIRLSNGRYQKVQVGDRIDGGRISAIGDSELRYTKGSRNLILKMPKS